MKRPLTIAAMSQTPTIVIVPGWRDSGPGHWQSLWAESIEGVVRVSQDNWISPTRSAWVARIAETVLAQDGPVVLVAHSLGCIASTYLPPEAVARIQGALFVAPADPERRAPLVDFAPVPYHTLPYRSVLVASSNDPYCPVRTAGAYARSWGSEFVRLQNAGHINIDAGFGAWPLGLALLQSLVETPLVFKTATPATSHSSLELQTV
jgi:predicted alpha/beta hydrolase family esterase